MLAVDEEWTDEALAGSACAIDHLRWIAVEGDAGGDAVALGGRLSDLPLLYDADQLGDVRRVELQGGVRDLLGKQTRRVRGTPLLELVRARDDRLDRRVVVHGHRPRADGGNRVEALAAADAKGRRVAYSERDPAVGGDR